MVESSNKSAGRLTDVAGITVGHWDDPEAATGCTVVLVPDATVASAQIRGGAPASRELALLEPTRTVSNVDAVVLTGGSAFGLAAADGVVAALEEQGRGVQTPAGRVPIVPTLALFDLGVGDPAVRPGPTEGRAAFDRASSDCDLVGRVGAGTGCTVDSWMGENSVRPGGLVTASERVGEVTVAALLAVNAFGSVGVDPSGRSALDAAAPVGPGANTTIGVVITDAALDKVGCHLMAQAAHSGMARSIFPSHTRWDGDAVIALATGGKGHPSDAMFDAVCQATCAVVERAVLTLR